MSTTVTVNRAFRFRLYPTAAQDAELREWERQLRWLYNLGHEQRVAALSRAHPNTTPGVCPSCYARLPRKDGNKVIDEGEPHAADCARSGRCWSCGARHKQTENGVVVVEGEPHGPQCERVDYYRQGPEMTELMRDSDPILRDQLGRVVCCARQEILRDLDKAWQRWRKRLGGKPRFKRRTDRTRIYISTTKQWRIEGESNKASLSLSGVAASVGRLEIRMDRPFPKDAKATSCHIVRDVDQWFAVFPLTFAVTVVQPTRAAVGINRGAVHAVADSDGRVVDSPGHYAKAMEKIARLSRDLARKELGSRNRHKAVERLARAHRKVRRQREFFLHQQSSYYASNYRMIAIEDWSTRQMTAKEPDETFPTREVKKAINRSILDVGWYKLARQIEYKVKPTEGEVRNVSVFDPEGERIGISSVCSACGAPLKGPASGRKHMLCEDCEHTELGDVNAAKNVLAREGVTPPSGKKAKTSIKIKGRNKRSETAVNRTVEASGGDRPVRRPDEGGTYERTVSTTTTHPPLSTAE